MKKGGWIDMAVMHNIPVDEPTEGHKESRKCPCNPEVQEIGGGKHIYHQYMNKVQEEAEVEGESDG